MNKDLSVEFRRNVSANLVNFMGSDHTIINAARVSTVGITQGNDDSYGLINFLMKNRHGSPFEHVVFTFAIECPIFVAREFMRHRMASYNEESGRYKQLKPVFYLPPVKRPLIQVGKPGAYTFEQGDEHHKTIVASNFANEYSSAYNAYGNMLAEGIAKEVARMVLPVGIFTSFYVTMNARGLMNFLSLRMKHENSSYPSYPQYEIELLAKRMDSIFGDILPNTHKAFTENGRVQP